ncbi:TetR/AcrR family transcriptional regulator [Amycolatopsis vastitatis]|uniref:TetR/AcrR family transcriptional regulator n=1 Tax=Amycolatopsis vastitatis TaxID=1905142 RepID=UPI00130428FD|nr:TetR/AcrR family transcriptional regulator [Amycolatopsis vastitatis]
MVSASTRRADEEDAAAQPGRDTRTRILEAAAEVLRSRGYGGTRMAEIAELAELQAATIYYYFPNREDMIESVIREGEALIIARAKEALAALPDSVSPLDKICTAATAHLDAVLSISSFSAASTRNFSHLPQEMQDRLMVQRREYGRLWKQLFDEALESGAIGGAIDWHVAYQLLMGSLNSAAEWWTPERTPKSELLETTVRLIRRAFQPPFRSAG